MSDDLLPPPAPPAPSTPSGQTHVGGFAPPVAPDQGGAVAGQPSPTSPRPSLITMEPESPVQAWPEPVAPSASRGRMNVVAIAVVGVLLIGAVVAFVFGGGGDGAGGGSTGPADTTLEFEQLWSAELDLGAAASSDDAGLSVAWADDEIVLARTMSTSGLEDRMFAIDNGSGEVLWDRPLLNRFGPDWVYVAGDVTLVTESIEDDRNNDGGAEYYAVLTALDTRTGEQRWQRDDLEIGLSWVPVGDLVVAMTEAEVVPETVDELVGLDLSSGEEVWSFRGEQPRLGLMVIRENGIVVGDGRDTAVGLGLDGEQRWTIDLEWAGGMMDASVERSDDVVGIRNGSDVDGVELETGEVLWSSRVGEVDSTSFVVTEPTTGLVVSCTTTEDSTEVSAFDTGSGEELWNESFADDAGGFVGFGDGTALFSDDGINNSGCLPLVNGRSTSVSQLTARNLADGTRAWGVDGSDLFVQLSTSAMGTTGTAGWTGGVGAARPDRSLATDDDRRQTLFDPQTGEFFVEDFEPDEDQPAFLQLFGSSVIGYDPNAQVLFDHPDRTTEYELRDADQPVAFENGVLFVFDGEELTAVD